MHGDGQRRFCEHCQLHVHNLSAMSRRERDRFVSESAGQACIAYQLRPDGSMVTLSLWRGMLRPFQRVQLSAFAVLAALLPFLFSACASRRTLGRMVPPAQTHSQDASVENTSSVTLGVPVPPASSHTKHRE
jgi:hypothetical protein